MDEEKNEEKETEQEQTQTSEETPEKEEDIDYDKELETLEETKKPHRTEKEKAIFTAKKIVERLEELEVDPSEIFGKKKAKKEEEEQPERTSNDIESRIEARLEAKRLARSDSEAKLILWYIENKGLSVEDAHILANKGRVKSFVEEQKRAKVVPEQGGGAGQKSDHAKKPELPQNEQTELLRQGFKKMPDGSFEGKKIRVSYDPSKKEFVISRK